MTIKEKKAAEAKETLLKNYIKPDTMLGIVITSQSKSGMTRRMRVLVDNFQDITWLVGNACGISANDRGLLITGCGMDMTFWLADTITHHLYGKDKPEGLTGNGGGCLNWKAIY